MTTAPTLTPMSPAVARLWHQLQSEFIKETHGVATVPPGAIVLPALPADQPAYFRPGVDCTVLVIGGAGNEDTYYKRHACPDGWETSWWNPAYWSLSQSRRDAQGRSWNCSGGDYVMDDFGDLVQVPA